MVKVVQGACMSLQNWKLYVVPCGKSYVVTKLEIVCRTMWEVVCFYDIGNGMLYNAGSCMLLRNWKSYIIRDGKSYVVTKLEIVC